MPEYLIFFLLTVILLGLELLYFKIADYYNIIDKPNERSSHSEVTLRGGGILFPIATLLFFICFQFQYLYFLIGLICIALISFLDDVITLNNKIRLAVHLISVGLLFYQWDLLEMHWYWLILAAIFVIGTINAYNFMDGINGITGSYSLIMIISLIILNSRLHFIDPDFLIITLISLLIFLYFNYRKTARCFAGDVGSISIAFIIIFALGSLIIYTHQLIYIMFLAVYGTDTVLTILARLFNGHNIFLPHRSHIYQLLSNERGFSQRLVAILYSAVQLTINIIIISIASKSFLIQLYFVLGIMLILTVGYIIIRYRIRKNYMNWDILDVN